jgi:hypothetical protein
MGEVRALLAAGRELQVAERHDSLGGYRCAVVDADDHGLAIGLPLRRDGLLDVPPGAQLAVRFDEPGDGAYIFHTVVIDVRPDDGSPYTLAWPQEVERRPHRASARVAMVLDAAYGVGNGGTAPDRPCRVVDLSAHGVGLITDTDLAVGQPVTVHCDLPHPDGPFDLTAVGVVRCRFVHGRTPGGRILHHAGVELTDLDETQQNKVLASVIWNLTGNPIVR